MMSPEWRPSHAYIPGQTPRHNEGLFDALKVGIEDVPPEKLNTTTAWIAGWSFLEEGYFWEAHEVFEAVWMAAPPNSPEKLMVQAVIQSANSLLKERMGRAGAAVRLAAEARRLAGEAENRAGGSVLGVKARDVHNNAYLCRKLA